MTIAIILSSLALLAATVNIFLTLREKKRSEKRKTAAIQYTDKTVRLAADRVFLRIAELDGQTAAAQEALEAAAEEFRRRLKALESGTVPDYEKAKEAANAVNDFNAGISGILGFDPMAALKKQRESAGEV